jgi:hypothetical protein
MYAAAVETLRKEERQDEIQFTTKIDGFLNFISTWDSPPRPKSWQISFTSFGTGSTATRYVLFMPDASAAANVLGSGDADAEVAEFVEASSNSNCRNCLELMNNCLLRNSSALDGELRSMVKNVLPQPAYYNGASQSAYYNLHWQN